MEIWSLKIKTRILPSYSHVGTDVWMHHLDFNEMPRKKNWMRTIQECCIEQILEAASYKTVDVWLLNSHLTDQVRWAGYYWRNKDKFNWYSSLTATHRQINVSWPVKTYIHQLCGHWISPEELSAKSNDREGWIVRESRESELLAQLES